MPVNQQPQVLFAGHFPDTAPALVLCGVVATQWQDMALGLLNFDLSALVHPVQIHLQSLLNSRSTSAQLGVICSLTVESLDCRVQFVDRDVM